MSSPITLSGFNNIDFNSIVEALYQQERQPVLQLQTQQAQLEKQKTAFGTLATRLSALESAASDLASSRAFSGTTASVSKESAVRASSASGAATGSYSLTVSALAQAQVTATNGTTPDADTTVVASGGSLVIGGKTVTVTGDVTMNGLAAAINETADIGVTASVVRSTGGAYQLVLTGKETGADKAFTVTNNLTGGGGVSFPGTNAQAAQDAVLSINNVTVTSSSNTVENAIPGVTLTLQEQIAAPVVITITADTSSVEELVKKFTSAYNELQTFLEQQTKAFANKERDNIGGDPLVRQLRNSLSRVASGEIPTGDTYTSLAQVGLSFNRTGQLEFRNADLQAAIKADRTAVMSLFQGGSGFDGAFDKMKTAVSNYTSSGGLIPTARTRLDDQLTKLGERISEMERRLAIRKEALQKEYVAADLAIAQLNSSKSQLGSFSSSLSSL
ncbi:flagellar hook-associated protein 2 [Luteitalea sp. TBR-22]|uniref:flagellar filament capping protein FliD n=1 Tax=Luteitalea sp. TBR-22 TaxID=2802971 RepID=UPI001AF9C021|nr:flagellar filament capping protein FliD [Luteitalea sp. TBR-22]BCS33506.1 flagellar hook-associated protein 2 [Luteitalea sp. TBR-22]